MNVNRVDSGKKLDAFEALAQENSKYEGRVNQLRLLMAICKDKEVTDAEDIHAIIYRYTNGKTSRRRDLSEKELVTLNQLLENCSKEEIGRVIGSVREKITKSA